MENIVEKLYSELHIDINIETKKGFPYIGKRQDNKMFSSMVKNIEEAWYFYDYELFYLL